MNLIELIQEHWRAGAEILVLWVLLYQIYRVFQASQGGRILLGLTFIIIFLTLGSQFLELRVISWILKGATTVLAFALLVIFQPELRSGLASLGSAKFLSFSTAQQTVFRDNLVDAVTELSSKRFGALFAIERGISLEDYADTGILMDSELSVELVTTIFHPKTALHDGGLILKKERLVAASCIFPVSQKNLSDRSLGLRHRAGFGICEETDAIAIIVSEETGSISIVDNDEIYRNLTEAEFRKKLEDIFTNHGQNLEEITPA